MSFSTISKILLGRLFHSLKVLLVSGRRLSWRTGIFVGCHFIYAFSLLRSYISPASISKTRKKISKTLKFHLQGVTTSCSYRNKFLKAGFVGLDRKQSVHINRAPDHNSRKNLLHFHYSCLLLCGDNSLNHVFRFLHQITH